MSAWLLLVALDCRHRATHRRSTRRSSIRSASRRARSAPATAAWSTPPPPGPRCTAVAGGTVTFGGVVAGTRYVVVDQPDGYRATYGRLAAAIVGIGAQVAAGAVVGTTTAGFYFGLRVGETYVDPAPLLGRLPLAAAARARRTARPRRPAPPTVGWRCGDG